MKKILLIIFAVLLIRALPFTVYANENPTEETSIEVMPAEENDQQESLEQEQNELPSTEDENGNDQNTEAPKAAEADIEDSVTTTPKPNAGVVDPSGLGDTDVEPVKNGWETVNGTTYYYKDGEKVIGWQKIGSKTFYFKKSDAEGTKGSMLMGWKTLGDKKFYFKKSGADGMKGSMLTGWSSIGSETFYFKNSGANGIKGSLVTGWTEINGNTYYFKKVGANGIKGKMLTGFQKLSGKRFYFKKVGSYGTKGKMLQGWQKISGKKYYFKKTGGNAVKGKALTGVCSIKGVKYRFSKDGVYLGKSEIVVIDPGHQRKGDLTHEPIGPGASKTKARVTYGTTGCVSGWDEYELNLAVSFKLRDELIKRGYTVYMTRTSHDVNISNKERAQFATAKKADILVRIHANGSSKSSVNGALCMAPSNKNPYLNSSVISKSQKLSRYVVDSYVAATGFNNQGVYIADDMSGINWSTMPVTIVEMGYMSNPLDDANMATASVHVKMVNGIAKGIDRYFGR